MSSCDFKVVCYPLSLIQKLPALLQNMKDEGFRLLAMTADGTGGMIYVFEKES